LGAVNSIEEVIILDYPLEGKTGYALLCFLSLHNAF